MSNPRILELSNRDAVPELRWSPTITRIEYGSEGRPAMLVTACGDQLMATCLRCRDQPCMRYAKHELALNFSHDFRFPANPEEGVCPTHAITIGDGDNYVVIDQDSCFGCGLCVDRCSFGAIHLDENAKAVVAHEDPENIAESGKRDRTAILPPRFGVVRDPDQGAISKLMRDIGQIRDIEYSVLVRNLLIQNRLPTLIRRKGDTNFRLDGLIVTEHHDWVIEVESGHAALESPRALAEDIAVLCGRHGFDRRRVAGLSLLDFLPNIRTEYYQVVEDIKAVLGIRISTVTIGVLFAGVWSRLPLSLESEDLILSRGMPDLDAVREALQPSFTSDIGRWESVFAPIK